VDLITRSGRLLGQTLAALLSFFNPSLVLLGGRVVVAGAVLLAAVREGVYRRSLSLATRDLRISLSSLNRAPDCTVRPTWSSANCSAASTWDDGCTMAPRQGTRRSRGSASWQGQRLTSADVAASRIWTIRPPPSRAAAVSCPP
jgi:predicted NBD/HSP70 family sugar kinase